MPSIAENLAAVLEKISDAAVKYGRKPEEVHLLAVSKTFPAEDIAEAFRAGKSKSRSCLRKFPGI